MKKVVVVGGGTGTFVVLTGLKQYTLDLSVIVSMMDSGGSTGRLRDQLGVLPPGDLRQCLVALSEAPALWRKLFLYRFGSGDLAGHNFGNLFLTALEKNTEDYQEVVDMASYILKTSGKVIPVTFDKVQLCVRYEDGEVIVSESLIDVAFHKKARIVDAFLEPKARANKDGLDGIKGADYIVIGPGDLYTSLIPNLIVDGVTDAVKKSSAKIINVMNLMTKRGQTTNYRASDHIDDLERYLGRPIDYVIANSGKISSSILSYYKSHGELQVADDLPNGKDNTRGMRVFRRDLLAHQVYNKSAADRVVRSILRHDAEKLGRALYSIMRS